MKVLYIFSGERKSRFIGKSGIDYPDTQFYGMDHLKNFGIEAEFREFESLPFGKLIKKIIGFRLKHFFMFFYAIKYDIVFGISVIYLLFWKKLFRVKTKFIIFNSVLNRMLIVHKPGTFKFKFLIWILKEVDGIVFLARVHMDKVCEKIPFLKDKSYFLHMGVDSNYYKPIYDNREDFFLSVGRDNARDYKTLVEVARLLPDQEFRFVCLERNLKGIENIPDNVKVFINIPMVDLQNMYRKAKALLLILHNDSYIDGSDSSGPTVLLEAMAIGLPIIASKKEYLKDYIEDGVNALFVDFYDVAGIVNSIHKIDNDQFRIGMAKNARDRIDSSFNTLEMARNLSKVFKKIYAEK